MFSPWYREALRGILDLEESDVARLEQQLATNPDDFPTRLKLMAYHQRADRAIHPEDRAERARHTLWLIEQRSVLPVGYILCALGKPDEAVPADKTPTGPCSRRTLMMPN